MKSSIRIGIACFITFAVSISSVAQINYETFANLTELKDGIPSFDVHIRCLTRLSTGVFVFDNMPTGDLVSYDPFAPVGSRTNILRTKAQIDADVGINSNIVVSVCPGIAIDEVDNIYVVLGDGYGAGTHPVYKTDAAGVSGSLLTVANGTTGIIVDGATVYLARVQFDGAPKDGFYRINTTDTGQTPSLVYENSSFDLLDLAIDREGDLYSISGQHGTTGALQNVVVKLSDPDGTPELSVLVAPISDGIFHFAGEGIKMLDLFEDHFYVFNHSYDGPNGEEWGEFALDGSGGIQFTNETTIAADPDVSSSGIYFPYNGMLIDSSGDIFLTNSSYGGFGGSTEIIRITGLYSATTSVEEAVRELPDEFVLQAAYPNPFNPETTIQYDIPELAAIRLAVYDLLGREVAVLVDKVVSAGKHTTTFDAGHLPSGSYISRLSTPAGDFTKMLLLLK